MTSNSIKQISRILEPIICEGIEEQVFTTRFPEQVAVIIAGITLNISDTLIEADAFS